MYDTCPACEAVGRHVIDEHVHLQAEEFSEEHMDTFVAMRDNSVAAPAILRDAIWSAWIAGYRAAKERV